MPAIREKGRLVSLTIDEPNRPVDRRPPLVTRLSLVARLTDALVEDGRPRETVRVRLNPPGRTPIYNLSGTPCFLDLPAGAYTLVIEGEHYFPESQPVTVPLPDPAQPVQTVTLRPLPSYPFPAGTTLIRGMVREAPDTLVLGAQVRVPASGPQTLTTDHGEFALAWPRLLANQVVTERQDGVKKRFVAGTGGVKQIQIEVTHPEYQTKTVTISELEEGTTVNLGIITVEQ